MFCQLDILKRLHTIPEIRLALTQLPKTLDETYDRILCNIPPENQTMVYRTLSVIGAGCELSLEELSDLLAVDLENPSFDRQNRPLGLYAPLEACTCLLTYDEVMKALTLSHYTVKEYLISSRIANGPAGSFQMTDDSMHAMTAACLIIYMLYENYESENEPLMHFAVKG